MILGRIKQGAIYKYSFLVFSQTIETEVTNSAINLKARRPNSLNFTNNTLKMSSKDLTSVTEQLAKTKVNETYELSFKNKGLKLNSAADGNHTFFKNNKQTKQKQPSLKLSLHILLT